MNTPQPAPFTPEQEARIAEIVAAAVHVAMERQKRLFLRPLGTSAAFAEAVREIAAQGRI